MAEPNTDSSNTYKVFQNQEAPTTDGQWTDNLFPPTEESLTGTLEQNKSKIDVSDIEWKKATEIFPQPYLFENTISVENLVKGKIGNCYFLASLAALCEFPGLISDIFLTREYNPKGYYKLRLFLDGEYQTVYLDDYFPCIKGTNIPYFVKPNSFELWAMLLEKAWAKVNKGYANIVEGWPSDVFTALTGFPCEVLDLGDEVNRFEVEKQSNEGKSYLKFVKNVGKGLMGGKDATFEDHVWNILRMVGSNSGLITCSTKAGEDVTSVGLEPGHAYTLVDTADFKNGDNLVRLCKLTNPWEKNNWSGDWSNADTKWTDSFRKQAKKDNEDEFFVSIEDLLKYFCRVDLCKLICDGYSQTFDFTQEELNSPQVFNFFLRSQGNVSISVMEKNWRYNRELTDVSHPTSLILAEYDPGLKAFKKIYCSYESFNDCQKSRTLPPGFYVLWVYKALPICQEPLPEFMKVRINSEGKIAITKIGPDTNFEIVQQIVYNGVKLLKNCELKNNEIFYDFSNDFHRSGLAYRLVINPLATAYQDWEVDATSLKDYSLLPPYNGQTNFKFQVGPNNFAVVLAIKNQKYGSFCFNLKSTVQQSECREGEDPVHTQRPPFDSFCLGNVNQNEPLSNKSTKTLEEITKKVKYPVVDHSFGFAQKYKEKAPLAQSELVKLPPLDTKKKLGWVCLQKPNGLYLGEAEYLVPNGRGMFIFNKGGLQWIGYFYDGVKGDQGRLFDRRGNLLYEGDYKNGIRNGNGTFYYPDGSKYVGEFVNGLREGKGVFSWNDGTYWDGTFKNNEMDGTGNFFDGEEAYEVEYKEGDLVE